MSERTIGNNRLIDGEKLDNLPDDVEAELDLKQDILSEGAFVDGDKTNLDNQSGTNTGDQTDVTGNAGTVTTINGKLSNGTNVTITGNGTTADPYVISASGSGGDLGDLTDVTIDTPITGQVIAYNSTTGEWENTTIAGEGDMLASTYDPNSVEADAFDAENIVYDNTDSGMAPTNVKTAIDKNYEQALMSNGGMTSEPTYTDNLDGTVTIGDGTCRFYTNTSWTGELTEETITGGTFTLKDSLTALTYIIVDYNSGSPIMTTTTDLSDLNGATTFPVYTCTRSGTDVCKLQWNTYGLGITEKSFIKDVAVNRFSTTSGLSLDETGTRNVTVTAGIVYYGNKLSSLSAVDTSTDNICFLYHSSGSRVNADINQYNNSQYDDGTDLQTLTSNRYAVNWVWRNVDEDKEQICIVLGGGDYTATQAEESSIPTAPTAVTGMCVFIGRIIVQQGDSTAYAIENVESVSLSTTGVTNHNNLSNLQGGTTDEYYHMTSAQNTIIGNTSGTNSGDQDLSSYATLIGTETFTNKTIDGDSNTISNLDIGNEVDWASSTDVTDASDFATGDKMLIYEAGVGLRKIDYDDLPSGSSGSVTLPLTHLAFYSGSTRYIYGFIEKDDGYVYVGGGVNNGHIQRYKKQAGQLILNNSDSSASYYFIDTSIVLRGLTQTDSSDDYIYYTTSTADTMYRVDVSTGTSTLMTISGITFLANSVITSDGTYLYIFDYGTTNCYKLSLSGTTATYVSTITLPVATASYAGTSPLWYGNSFYYISTNNSIVKCDDDGTLDYQLYTTVYSTSTGYGQYNVFFEFNNYIMLGYIQYDSEDTTGVGLQIIEDLN